MSKIDWGARRDAAHKACPCLCQIFNNRPCWTERGIDDCYLCADFHYEANLVVQRSMQEAEKNAHPNR